MIDWLANLQAPVKAILGAWSHAWPHEPYPKPGMEWRHEAVGWFDHWLKGIEDGWPIARSRDQVLFPQPDHTLGPGAPRSRSRPMHRVPTGWRDCPTWHPMGR